MKKIVTVLLMLIFSFQFASCANSKTAITDIPNATIFAPFIEGDILTGEIINDYYRCSGQDSTGKDIYEKVEHKGILYVVNEKKQRIGISYSYGGSINHAVGYYLNSNSQYITICTDSYLNSYFSFYYKNTLGEFIKLPKCISVEPSEDVQTFIKRHTITYVISSIICFY